MTSTTDSKLYGPCPTPFSDHVYKTAHGVDVSLRVWPREGDAKAPWVLWCHGGGWTGGYNQRMLGWTYPAFHGRGYHIVSVGYRLCPHVGVKDQIEDLQDAYVWCRKNLPTTLAIDIDSYVVGGDSAGGYFTALSPFVLSPPPKALVDLYGPTNLIDPTFMASFYDPPVDPAQEAEEVKKINMLLPGRDIKDYHAYWDDRDPSKALTIAPWWWDFDVPVETLRSYMGLPDYTPGEREKMVMDVFRWVGITKTLTKVWLRYETFSSMEDFKTFAKSLSPLFKLDEVGKNHPATFILHGTADQAVPIHQSHAYEKKLREIGIPVQAIYADKGEHSFDATITSPDEPGWNQYIVPALNFVDTHVRK